MDVDQNRIEGRLKAILARPDTVVLVGSGLSLWSGLPSWPALLTKLADFLREKGRDVENVIREISGGDLLLAASYATYALSPRDLGVFLRAQLASAEPSSCHKLVLGLGPTCFVTTNYDTLIEDTASALGMRRPTVVTNRQVAELAEIIPASSRNFLYKYHGDISDAESIVLSRAQYRKVQHENHAASRTFSTLLATRPVVMIGFGLRDPDFLNIQDDLISTFGVQAGEYYAILPDQNDEDVRFWRNEYRVELVSYPTRAGANGRDHSALLDLLARLQPAEQSSKTTDVSADASSKPDLTFMLARLGASMSRGTRQDSARPLPVNISTEEPFSRGGLYGVSLADFFSRAPRVHMIIGSAGAGKTFAIKQKVAEMAEGLTNACLHQGHPLAVTVPIYVRMSSYTGRVLDLIEQSMPLGLSTAQLFAEHKCHVFLDAINEAPRAFIESGQLATDIKSLCEQHLNLTVTITSRRESWLDAFDYPSFLIDDLSEQYVFDNIAEEWKDALENLEILRVLRRPLLFSIAMSGDVDPQNVTVPTDIYGQLFDGISKRVSSEVGSTVNLVSLLSGIAHDMLASGVEVQSRDVLEALPRRVGQQLSWSDILSKWGVISPLPENLFSFFHQSATEYLAATIMVGKYELEITSILSYLSDKRWDQAVFLLFGLLGPESKDSLFRLLMSVDVVAAARAAFYADFGSADFTKLLLDRIIDGKTIAFDDRMQLAYIIDTLPVPKSCADQVAALSEEPDILGGWAASKLAEMIPERQQECLDRTLKRANNNDYNYVSRFVDGSRYWAARFAPAILYYLDGFEDKDAFHPLAGIDGLLAHLSDEEIVAKAAENTASSNLIPRALREGQHHDARRLLSDLIKVGNTTAVFELYLDIRFDDDWHRSNMLTFDHDLLTKCLDFMRQDEGKWSAYLLGTLIENREDWMDGTAPFEKSPDFVTSAAVRFLRLGKRPVEKDDEIWLGFTELPASIQEMVLSSDQMKLASADTIKVAMNVLSPEMLERFFEYLQDRMGEIELVDVKPLGTWLELLRTLQPLAHQGFMTKRALTGGGPATREALRGAFVDPNGDDFWELVEMFSGFGISLEKCNLPASVYEKAMTRMERRSIAHFIGAGASEDFIERVLLSRDDLLTNENLGRVLDLAGERHNRRYAPERFTG